MRWLSNWLEDRRERWQHKKRMRLLAEIDRKVRRKQKKRAELEAEYIQAIHLGIHDSSVMFATLDAKDNEIQRLIRMRAEVLNNLD